MREFGLFVTKLRQNVHFERSDSLLIPCYFCSNRDRLNSKRLYSLEIVPKESRRTVVQPQIFPVYSRLSGNRRSRDGHDGRDGFALDFIHRHSVSC